MALVAVGGYGRAELAPGSDLDVLLLHDGKRLPATVTETLWYPIWDAKLKLGHAVRSVKEALRLASGDLDTATALLSVRHVAGDPALTASLADGARAQWRKRSRSWLDRVRRGVDERHAAARRGGLPARAQPEGGAGRAARRPRPVVGRRWPPTTCWPRATTQALREAYDVLLAARVELHRLHRPPGRRARAAGPGRGGGPAPVRRRRPAHGRRQRRRPARSRGSATRRGTGCASLAGRVRQVGRTGARRRPRCQRPARRGPPGRRRRPGA